MKKIITSVLALCFIQQFTVAQITITNKSGYYPGDFYTLKPCSTDNNMPSAAGANVNVSYSTLTNSSASQTVTYISPSTTPFSSSFPGATVATSFASSQVGDNTVYYNVSASKLELLGLRTPTYSMVYSNPQEIIKFPTAYNDNYSDNFSSSYSVAPYDGKRSGTVVSVADAYGNITTPVGTYPYLRMKTTQTIYDSLTVNGNLVNVSVSTTISYNYFNSNYKTSLFNYSEATTPQGTTKSAYYYVSGSTGINENGVVKESIKLYPNPAKHTLYIDTDLSQLGHVDFKVFDINGKLMNTQINTQLMNELSSIPLNISSLTPGFYSLVIESEKGINKNIKFIVE
jgi:Secretion system C-terminal sorting domain